MATFVPLCYQKNMEFEELAGFNGRDHTDIGAPVSPDYSPGYYVAFILDPDGDDNETVSSDDSNVE